jgi:hypothetical protein
MRLESITRASKAGNRMKRKFVESDVYAEISAESPLLRGNGRISVELRPTKNGRSPTKALAAAVLLDALTKICEPCDISHCKREVSEDLEWVFSDEIKAPFSFLQLCRLLELEPSIIRDFILLRIYNHSALA